MSTNLIRTVVLFLVAWVSVVAWNSEAYAQADRMSADACGGGCGGDSGGSDKPDVDKPDVDKPDVDHGGIDKGETDRTPASNSVPIGGTENPAGYSAPERERPAAQLPKDPPPTKDDRSLDTMSITEPASSESVIEGPRPREYHGIAEGERSTDLTAPTAQTGTPPPAPRSGQLNDVASSTATVEAINKVRQEKLNKINEVNGRLQEKLGTPRPKVRVSKKDLEDADGDWDALIERLIEYFFEPKVSTVAWEAAKFALAPTTLSPAAELASVPVDGPYPEEVELMHLIREYEYLRQPADRNELILKATERILRSMEGPTLRPAQ